jgi:hypothetical protein
MMHWAWIADGLHIACVYVRPYTQVCANIPVNGHLMKIAHECGNVSLSVA